LLADIEKLLKAKIGRKVIPGYEPDPRIKAEPITMGWAQRFSGKKNWRSQNSSASSKGRNSGKRRSLARQA
jgi:ATP-dependent RNA helicase RhlE